MERVEGPGTDSASGTGTTLASCTSAPSPSPSTSMSCPPLLLLLPFPLLLLLLLLLLFLPMLELGRWPPAPPAPPPGRPLLPKVFMGRGGPALLGAGRALLPLLLLLLLDAPATIGPVEAASEDSPVVLPSWRWAASRAGVWSGPALALS